VEVNGPAFHAVKGKVRVRILSPVDGEVVEARSGAGPGRLAGAGGEWLLRVRPEGGHFDARPLLTGGEVRPWVLREVERLQRVLQGGGAGATLADGGAPVDDISGAIPEEERDALFCEMFLEA
jgi:hypothetical protein